MNRTPLDLKTLEKRPERFTPEESANLQPEPHTGLVDEGARPRRIGLDLLTKLPHEHAKILRILGERRPPKLGEESTVGDDLAGVSDEERQGAV